MPLTLSQPGNTSMQGAGAARRTTASAAYGMRQSGRILPVAGRTNAYITDDISARRRSPGQSRRVRLVVWSTCGYID